MQVSTTCSTFNGIEVCPESLSSAAGELQMLTLQVKCLNLFEGVYQNGSVFSSAEHLSSLSNQQEFEKSPCRHSGIKIPFMNVQAYRNLL